MENICSLIYSGLTSPLNLEKQKGVVFAPRGSAELVRRFLINFSELAVVYCHERQDETAGMSFFPTGTASHNFHFPPTVVEYVKKKNIDTVFILPDTGEPLWRCFLGWYRCGIRHYYFPYGANWRRISVLKEIIRRLPLVTYHLTYRLPTKIHIFCYHQVGKALYRFLQKMLPEEHCSLEVPHQESFKQDTIHDNINFKKSQTQEENKYNVVKYTGQLGPGGSERQMCNLAKALINDGHNVSVLCTYELEGRSAHYCELLEECKIYPRMAGNKDFPEFEEYIIQGQLPGKKHLLPAVPPYLAPQVFSLYAELHIKQPDILHCWLDQPNIMGAMAGYLADVPVIILSTRNINPSNFPRFHEPYFKPWYHAFTESKRVTWIANSQAGANDYADWLGIDPNLFRVIRNGVDFSLIAAAREDAHSFRLEEKIPDTVPLVVGVFRLDPEKRPLDFLKVIAKVKKQIPEMMAVMAGVGCMEDEVRTEAAKAGLADTVRILGRRNDVYRIMRASDVMLLTSKAEGTPNVLLEAQHLKLPVVATKAGGTPETIHENSTGFLHDIGDISGLSESTVRLLQSHELRCKMGEAGKKFVDQNYSFERMLEETKDLYSQLFANSRH